MIRLHDREGTPLDLNGLRQLDVKGPVLMYVYMRLILANILFPRSPKDGFYGMFYTFIWRS